MHCTKINMYTFYILANLHLGPLYILILSSTQHIYVALCTSHNIYSFQFLFFIYLFIILIFSSLYTSLLSTALVVCHIVFHCTLYYNLSRSLCTFLILLDVKCICSNELQISVFQCTTSVTK